MTHSTNQPQINSLVWLGPGLSADLDKIKQADQAVLVDASADVIKALKKQLSKAVNIKAVVTLDQLYLAAEADEAEFYQYNLTEYSALSKISGFKQLFPGLQLTQTRAINTTGITDFIAKLQLDDEHNNVLWLEIIDQALPMLQALLKTGLLNRFDQIQIQGSLASLYQDAATARDIRDFLTQEGYELKAQDNSDPDLPILSFSVNTLWQPLKHALKQLEQAKQQRKEDQLKAAEQQKGIEQLNALKADQEKAFSEKTNKLEEQAKSLADKDTKLAEMAKQIEAAKQLEVTTAEQSKTLTEKNAKLEELTKQLEALEASKTEQAKVLVEKNAKLEEQAKTVVSKEADITELAKQIEVTKADFEKALASKDTKLAEHAKAIAEKNAKLEEHAKAIAQKNAELEEHAKAIAEKNTKLEALSQFIADQNAKQKSLNEEKETVRVERDKAREERDFLKKKQDQTENKLNAKANLLNEKALHLNAIQKQFSALSHEHIDLEKKHNLLLTALTKAEAQIDIIKDLLIKPDAQ